MTLVADRFRQSIGRSTLFFEQYATEIAQACLVMARRFQQGGRLLAFAAGNARTDAQHISVEFVHPVIVGKRALPAIALGTDLAATVGMAQGRGWEQVYAMQVGVIGRSSDIAIGIAPIGDDAAVMRGLATATERDMLTIALTGGAIGQVAADFCFHVDSVDLHLVQEIHETLYHIFWESVHVFFEHPGLLEVA